MKLSLFGRWSMALFASLALGLGMTACGGGTIGYMWVLGQEYNNIAGFKIDDYTGNLTQIINSPFASNGSTPVSIVVKPGGRYVYVINQGKGGTATSAGAGQSIALYSVGGDGTLNYQQSYFTQGYISQWAQMDATGTYLYVLDKYSPDGSGFGSISAFTSDPNTGRLALITNTNGCGTGTCPTVFDVGQSPFMMKTAGGCLFTVNQASPSNISQYAVGSGGVLTQAGLGSSTTISPTPGQITSITATGSNVYLTDGKNDVIYQYTVGTNCSLIDGLTTTQGPSGNVPAFANVTNPSWTLVDSTGKYLYVLNQSSTSTITGTPFSSITAYTINATNQQLTPIAGAPYTVGSGPVCMSEDPTNQYMYISNFNDGTVTGKVLDPNTGELSSLTRGSTFTSVGQSSCLAISGAIN
jgi:6-phosphogluconolactonase (cycloisomerase 2 family)